MRNIMNTKLGRCVLVFLIVALIAIIAFSIFYFAWYFPRYQSVVSYEGELAGKYFSKNSGILNSASVAVSGFPPDVYFSEDMIYTRLRADPPFSAALEPIVLTPMNFDWLFRSQNSRPYGQKFTFADLREYRLHALAAWRVKTENGYTFFLLMDNTEYLISVHIYTKPDLWRSRQNQNVSISSYFE